MATFKICPKCQHKNLPNAISCEKCNTDLFFVGITDDGTSDFLSECLYKKNNNDSNQYLDSERKDNINYSKIFSEKGKEAPLQNQKVIKPLVKDPIETPIDEPMNSADFYKYCFCGNENAPSAVICNKCGADISSVPLTTKEKHDSDLINKISKLKQSGQLHEDNSLSSNNPLTNPSKTINCITKIESINKSLLLDLKENPIEIGRNSSNMQIKAYLNGKKYVSRNHAEIIRSNTKFFVKDVGSTNGTFINGKKIDINNLVEIHVGDTISFGGDGSSYIEDIFIIKAK